MTNYLLKLQVYFMWKQSTKISTSTQLDWNLEIYLYRYFYYTPSLKLVTLQFS